VFDLFVHANPSSCRPDAGSGIGLALVRSLVEVHGGHVGAASAGRGNGSEFTVRLPMAAE
jgi:signal transduction histidine kinase